jgi:hypothetical protein
VEEPSPEPVGAEVVTVAPQPSVVYLTSEGRVLASVESWIAALIVLIAVLLVVLVALLSVRLGFDNTIATDVEWIRANLSGTAS